MTIQTLSRIPSHFPHTSRMHELSSSLSCQHLAKSNTGCGCENHKAIGVGGGDNIECISHHSNVYNQQL
ncbi:hypothetical protein MKX01_035662 [Papaver californicum]|nr:hypothetical protein MKX01_035662 [Papaver californicum]